MHVEDVMIPASLRNLSWIWLILFLHDIWARHITRLANEPKVCCVFYATLDLVLLCMLVFNCWTVIYYPFQLLRPYNFPSFYLSRTHATGYNWSGRCLMRRLRCLTWRLQVICHFSKVFDNLFFCLDIIRIFFPPKRKHGHWKWNWKMKMSRGKATFPLCIWYSNAVLNKLYYRIFLGVVSLAKFHLA